MRIGIDARMMGPGCAGIGRYIEELVKHLLLIDKKNEYVLFLRKENFQATSYQLPATSCVVADIPWYSLKEQLQFKKIIDRENVGLMHFPHWNVPLFYNEPFVVTVHDLIMWHYPRVEASTLGPITYWLKDIGSRLVVKHAVKAAKHILTTSEFTKQDIYKTLRVPLEKMTVTYQATFGENPKSEIRNPKQIQMSNVKGQMSGVISKPYVLYVGSAYPHKNLGRLLEAWQIANEKLGGKYQLVLVGKENFFYKKLQMLNVRCQMSSVVYAGFVPDDELESFYAKASLYVAPSLYEGFALPALEAMARGVPVVASNRTCFPEVLGEAAMYFDPGSVNQMADVIFRALNDNNLRFELAEKGRGETQLYSWKALAQKTLAVYQKAVV